MNTPPFDRERYLWFIFWNEKALQSPSKKLYSSSSCFHLLNKGFWGNVFFFLLRPIIDEKVGWIGIAGELGDKKNSLIMFIVWEQSTPRKTWIRKGMAPPHSGWLKGFWEVAGGGVFPSLHSIVLISLNWHWQTRPRHRMRPEYLYCCLSLDNNSINHPRYVLVIMIRG